jgi:hypothetical protein
MDKKQFWEKGKPGVTNTRLQIKRSDRAEPSREPVLTQAEAALKVCVACDFVDDFVYYTHSGAGPFCSECWEALSDPDQALLTEKRLAEAEKVIEAIRTGLEELQRELQTALREKGGQ